MAVRAVNPFVASIYAETKGTDEDKLRAVNAEFERMRKAQLSAAEVQRAFGVAMQTSQSKVQLANNKLDELAQSADGERSCPRSRSSPPRSRP